MPIRTELRHFYRTPEWKAARAACRDRARDRCEQCGQPNGRILFHRDVYDARTGEPRRVVVQCGCAHLDNDPANNAPDNLAWLCRKCHLHRDAPFHRLTRATRKDAARPILRQLERGTE